MEQFNDIKCRPVFVYSVIGLIVLCIKTLIRLKYRPFNLIAFFTQLGSIVLCALVLIGMCNISCDMAWGLTIILVLCTLAESFIVTKKWISYGNKEKI
ncbi:hypothetical protein QKU48_gp1423 [Fadolivirus algeromassiliense]|jgi:ethanolamine transporter EutH|uniref:Uncharacterized protein n=1 Tax=Fadolivirus FV1/VV64 TaxID=3070911 RepID=A0A7D3R276_9VIRU|nr:hypothetical protein QKU48_gp1423 [Fadolivirus algeromassiliense]QKF94881.1 hypothetical protein Fadolivirus_1_1423 [Fadolivirus FV1/VV64]